MTLFILAVTTALVVSFVCSIFEAVLLSVGHARVEELRRQEKRAGTILDGFRRSMEAPIAAILILNTFAHTVGASVAGATYSDVFDPSTLWIFSLVFTLAILLCTEIIPKTLGFAFRDALAAPVALAVRALVLALKPAIAAIQLLTRFLRPAEEPPITSEKEIRLLASIGRAEGVVHPSTAAIIEGTATLREVTAADVMMPRSLVVFLSGQESLEENLRRVRDSGHSRFPFTPSGEPDEVTGVVLAKELLFHARENDGPVDWEALVDVPLLVPGSVSLQQLMRLFQDERRHLAVVLDEHGGVDGIVTLEDVLEELVGEIWDESDRRPVDIVDGPKGTLRCRGRIEVRQVAAKLGIEIDTEATTLSGFLSERLGAVPKAGDEVRVGEHDFKVLKAGRRRAELIEIRRPEAQPSE
ncbi:MAG: hemolysin family protein [Gemmatimonadetes bacterium]|nr:hemolysin family protein [Gemmatimonadota bacterium]